MQFSLFLLFGSCVRRFFCGLGGLVGTFILGANYRPPIYLVNGWLRLMRLQRFFGRFE